MSFWNSLRIASSALSAQRLRLDIISNNVANAETTRTEAGGAYQRQDVVFTPQGANSNLPRFLNVLRSVRGGKTSIPPTDAAGVRVASIETDTSEGPQIFDPSHPDADEQGYVSYPNVNILVEMTNMISATRSYEAGLSVVEAAKRMAQRALDIGR
jgi:flagellar basal-body rod protein FlgC